MFDSISTGKYWDKALTLISGCTPCSPGCDHCWALAMEHRFQKTECKGFDGRRKVEVHPERLDIPLKRKKPTVYAIWNDAFHPDVPNEFLGEAFRIMETCPQHIFLVLTKRAKGMADYLDHYKVAPNIWLGVSVCTPDELFKVNELLNIQAAVRWVSIEPMLGDIDLAPWWLGEERKVDCGGCKASPVRGHPYCPGHDGGGIDWVVLGGETGLGARPMFPGWARSVRDQCQAAGVPFFFKQWGRCPYPANTDISEWISAGYDPYARSKNGGCELDGRPWNELPESLIKLKIRTGEK